MKRKKKDFHSEKNTRLITQYREIGTPIQERVRRRIGMSSMEI